MSVSDHQSFKSIEKVSRWLLNAIVAGIVVNILSLIVPIIQNIEFLVRNEMVLTYLGSEPFDAFLNVIATIINFVIGVVTLFWFYSANKNIHSFGAKKVSSPRMAVIWFFIPILNLWKPYTVAQQIWKASNTQTIMSEGTEWKNSPSSKKIKFMWILGLTHLLISIVFGYYFALGNVWDEFMNNEETVVNFQRFYTLIFYGNLINIVGMVLGIFFQIFYLQIVRQISLWQETIGKTDSSLKRV